MAKTRKRSTTQKPFWERSYRGHAYWLGKLKLGRVTLHSGQAQHKYTWEAAGRTGASDELEQAKAAVELAVSVADRQLPLFD